MTSFTEGALLRIEHCKVCGWKLSRALSWLYSSVSSFHSHSSFLPPSLLCTILHFSFLSLYPSFPPFLFLLLSFSAISNFFVCGESNRCDVIPIILKKLESFLRWFQTQTSLRLFATSLLIVYEGDHTPGHTHKPMVDIRLVDFAHTYECAGREEGTDVNTLFGLENFTQCLTTLNRQLTL